jgi:hypothetical protein
LLVCTVRVLLYYLYDGVLFNCMIMNSVAKIILLLRGDAGEASNNIQTLLMLCLPECTKLYVFQDTWL